MGLAAAERSALADKPQQLGTACFVAADAHRQRRGAPFVRQNLPPIKASQVTGIFRGHVTVGDEQVLPTVIIQVDKYGTPRPPPKFDSRFRSDLDKGSITHVAKQGIPFGKSAIRPRQYYENAPTASAPSRNIRILRRYTTTH